MPGSFGAFSLDPLAQLDEVLGQPVTDYPNDPGSYAPANRPQDIRYEFPERGAENHGVTDDNESTDYFPDQVTNTTRIVTDDGSTTKALELVPPIPVAVYEIPNPLRSIRKWTTFHRPFPPREQVWDFTNYVQVPDMNTVITFGADENRARVTFIVGYPPSGGAVGSYYMFAVSNTPTFDTYSLLSTINTVPFTLTLENMKEAFYLALVPIGAYAAGVLNRVDLQVIQEWAAPIDHNPWQV